MRTYLVATLILLLGATMKANAKTEIKELGIPVKSVNWVRVFPGQDGEGRACLYAIMGQQGDNFFVLQIDPQTGKFRQLVAPAAVAGSNYPTAALMASDGRLYVGAAYSGHLFRFDPKGGKLEDLGAINLPADTFPCRIDEAPDGSLFIGCYGSAGLTRYDPKRGEFTRYGRMDQVDMYCYPLVAADGMVACEIKMTKPHVVLLDPKTGEKKAVGPTITAGEPGQSLWLFRGTDHQLYIGSSAGNFRIEGMEAKPVEAVPNAAPAPLLADGSSFAFSDAGEQEYRRLAITSPAGEKRELTLDYQAAGSDIFLVHRGPDGDIYGSSVLPLHLFRYRPQSGEVVDLGRCSAAAGEAYSMGNLEGKLYICSYPAAALSVYDPARPYHYGTEATDNPRELGPMDEHISYRPRAMLTGPLGRVWTGSEPNYGIWGGPLAWYDPQTGKKGSYRHVLQDQSVVSLAWAESVQMIVGGTSIGGGSGTQPKAKQAALFLWDPAREAKAWWRAPRQGTEHVYALVAVPGGNIYGVAVGHNARGAFREIFVFDPVTRRFVAHLPVPEGGIRDNALQVGADGQVYGVTSELVFRIDPATRQTKVLVEVPGQIGIPGPLVGKTLYFASGTKLRALAVP